MLDFEQVNALSIISLFTLVASEAAEFFCLLLLFLWILFSLGRTLSQSVCKADKAAR